MKTTLTALLGLLLAATLPCRADDPPKNPSRAANPADPAGRSDEEKAIRAEFEAFGQAFQKGDAGAIAALFTEEGEAIGVEGETIQGARRSRSTTPPGSPKGRATRSRPRSSRSS